MAVSFSLSDIGVGTAKLNISFKKSVIRGFWRFFEPTTLLKQILDIQWRHKMSSIFFSKVVPQCPWMISQILLADWLLNSRMVGVCK